MEDAFHRFFAPRAVAVIGASARPDALSRRFTSGLARHGYRGRIVPVNPSYEEIDGLPCYPAVAAAERPQEIDLAVLAVAAERVPAALEDCAAAGVAGAIVFSGGFAETGEEGAEAERRIADYARAHGIRLLGPNSPGFVNFAESICVLALGVAYRVPLVRGAVGLVAQSGGVGGLVCERTQDLGVGFSRFVAVGNEADVSAGELLRWLAADPETRVVGVYLEGVRDPGGLCAGLEALAEADKPAVVLKPDASGPVARASVAHTGVLATPDDVFAAVLHRHGATRARTVEELVDALVALERIGRAAARRVGLLSASGGAAVLATQAADRAGLELPAPAATTRARLASILPGFAAVANPADLTGAFVEDRTVLSGCLDAFGADPGYDTVVVVQTVHPPELADRIATNLIDYAAVAERPPVVLWTAGEMSAAARARLRGAGLVVYEDADRCMRALAARSNRPRAAPEPPALPAAAAFSAQEGGQLPDDEAFGLLAAAGLPVPDLRVAASPAEAVAAQSAIGGAVAVKAIGLAHKAREGGLVLGVASAEAAAEAHERVTAAAGRAGGDPRRSLVQAQVARGAELIVGARREPGFGTLLLVGPGGQFAELACGVARRLLPLADGEAAEMLDESGLGALLAASGEPARERVAAAIERVAALAAAAGDRLEAIEVNPLVVEPGGAAVAAVDVLAVLSPSTMGER